MRANMEKLRALRLAKEAVPMGSGMPSMVATTAMTLGERVTPMLGARRNDAQTTLDRPSMMEAAVGAALGHSEASRFTPSTS